MTTFFPGFQLDRIENKDILASFEITRIHRDNHAFFRFSREYNGQNIVFFISPLSVQIPSIWNLLTSPFFPNSVTILTKLGKRMFETHNSNEEALFEAGLAHPTFQRYHLELCFGTVVLENFRYKQVSFVEEAGSYLTYLVRRGKSCRVPISHEHILIRYFLDLLVAGRFESRTFELVRYILETAPDTEDGATNLLNSITYSFEDDALYLDSLYTQGENSLISCNVGVAASAQAAGIPVVGGRLNLATLMSSRSNSSLESLLEPVQLTLPTDHERLAENLTSRLTSVVVPDYNESTTTAPDLCYWNI